MTIEEFLEEYQIVSQETGHVLSPQLARNAIEGVIDTRLRWIDGATDTPAPPPSDPRIIGTLT